MYIPTNVTAEEYFRFFCEDENSTRFYEELVKELEIAETEVEILREQLEKAEFNQEA